VDDLALLVDLVSSGWRGIDARLDRLERGQARAEAIVESLPGRDAEAELDRLERAAAA